MNRVIGFVAALAMITANAALIMRDLAPSWTAGNPPVPMGYELSSGWIRVTQTGIFDESGKRLGGIWTETWRDDHRVHIDSMTVLDEFEVSGETLTPALRIDSRVIYNDQRLIERMTVTVRGFGLPISFRGQYEPPDDFACHWRFDEQEGDFLLPAETTRAIGDLRSPFQGFGQLHVGQTWRHELLDPLAKLLPGLQGSEMRPQQIIVRVTGTEKIEHNGIAIKAFVLEADRIRAWVSPLGDVLRQELTVPMLGRITLVDEPFDDNAREAARRSVIDTQLRGSGLL